MMDVEGKYAQIQIVEASSSSPDSHNGLEGWVNSDYIQCACDEQTYYVTENKQKKEETVVTLQSNAAIAQTEEPIGLDGLENDSEIVQQRNETDSSLNIFIAIQ